ncbi:hypothetical protein [Acidipropionibacterium timonense]|uniref:hypothetical protein n=1 Tax=Acidipropionibacterium timonense TaxID=2161818 RepID=UPI001436C214|nr:hypothetical protein [Acidipropionibacterium timonense]
MLTTAYGLGFNVYAMTDHNVVNTRWDRTDTDHAKADPKYYLTSDEVKAMADGQGRKGGAGMIGIPYSDEQSQSDHLNTFWANWNNAAGDTLETKVAHVDAMTGNPDPIQHINHPGRYYGGSNTKLGPNGEDLGAQAANDPKNVGRYVSLFKTYPNSLVGMEIVNKVSDGDSYSDRILWDNVLARTLPERNVWGFANDDAHSTDALGYAYNQMLMPDLSEGSVYKAMKSGTFYTTALVAKRELGKDFKGDRSKPGPVIDRIAIDQEGDSMTITSHHSSVVEWISNGKVIATGDTLSLDAHSADLGTYVRAQIKGPNGISFTQPFALSAKPDVAEPGKDKPGRPDKPGKDKPAKPGQDTGRPAPVALPKTGE